MCDDAGSIACGASIAEPFACGKAFDHRRRTVHTTIPVAQSCSIQHLLSIDKTPLLGAETDLRAGPVWERMGLLFLVSVISFLKIQLQNQRGLLQGSLEMQDNKVGKGCTYTSLSPEVIPLRWLAPSGSGVAVA